MDYYVYILTNKSGTLYTGVTNDLERRVQQHKDRAIPGFTARYKIDRLVYYERFNDVNQAIEWEKRIKGWVRAKKIALIESVNPRWEDLSSAWYDDAGETAVPAIRDPSLRVSTRSTQDDTVRRVPELRGARGADPPGVGETTVPGVRDPSLR